MAVIILVGKSGSGKDTICQKMLDVYGDSLHKMVSATTRSPREGEQDGIAYRFISNDDFEKKIKSGEIFEFREYDSSKGKVYYGSEKEDLSKGDYIKILDIEGARIYQEAYGRNNCFVVEVDVPDDVRYKRAYQREFDKQEPPSSRASFDAEWNKRLEKDNADFSEDLKRNVVNFKVKNIGDIEQSVCDISEALNVYERHSKDNGRFYTVVSANKGLSYELSSQSISDAEKRETKQKENIEYSD